MKKVILCFFLILGLIRGVEAQTAPSLGVASDFTILAGTGIYNTDASQVSGNVGVWPGTVITGFLAGEINGNQHAGDAKAQQAQTDLNKAYLDLAALPASANGNLTGQSLSGQTLGPGVYTFNTAANLSGTITLNANDNPNAVFIFRVNGDLTLAPNTLIDMANNGRRLNIFWQVTGNVIVGEGSNILGNVIAQQAIRLDEEATLMGGRLLSLNGAVNLIKNDPVTMPTDLAITKAKSNGKNGVNPYDVGELVTFTIVAENLGPNDDYNVTLIDQVSLDLEYISAEVKSSVAGKTVNNTVWNPSLHKLQWNADKFDKGETVTLTLVVRIVRPGVISNTATILGTVTDDNLNNNGSSVTPNICAKIFNPGQIKGPSSVCVQTKNNVYSIDAIQGVTYNWRVPVGWRIVSAMNAPTITVEVSARGAATSGFVTVTVNNGCGPSNPSSKAVTAVSSPPPAPVAIIPSPDALNTCIKNSSTVTYRIDPVSNADTYNWTIVPLGKTPANNWQIVSGNGTTQITVQPGEGEVAIKVVAVNSCGESPAGSLTVSGSVDPPVAPAAITGNQQICAGIVASYTVAAVPGASGYEWAVPAGWEITAGQGTTTIKVKAGPPSSNPAEDIITVIAKNACGSSTARSLAVVPTVNLPAVPGVISGSGNVCANQGNITYNVAPVPGASTYVWTVPAGWIITAGQGTPSISVLAKDNAGSVSVRAENSCGKSGTASVLPVSITSVAAITPGAISGPKQVCAGETDLTYSIKAVSGASGYIWVVPEADGWQILTGQGTTSVTIKTGTKAGEVQVKAINGCGPGAASKLAVSFGSVPAAPGTISGPTDQCAGNTNQVYEISAVTGAKNYNWEVPAGWQIASGQGTTAIRVTVGTVSGDVKVSAANACGTGTAAILAVISSTVPAPAPTAIHGDVQDLVCTGQVNLNYFVDPVPGAVYYVWEISNSEGWEITAGQGTISIQVTAGPQAAIISVKAVNGCGASASAAQEIKPANVEAIDLGAITGPGAACAGQSNVTYSVPEVNGATQYTWVIPADWKITAGQNTPAITVTMGKTAGQVSVTAANACASSQASVMAVAINPAPAAPARIIENSSPCAGLVYAVDALPGATGYIWSVPAGWSILAGQGTTQIKVQAAAGSREGIITVAAETGTCASASVTLLANATLAQTDITISNVFSPNGDGVNDAWNIANIENFPENELVVINRWGSEVYRAKAYRNNWNGDQLTAGTYYYVLKIKLCEGYQTQKGYVMIMR